jgi:AcrR family transcriptional regulator
MATTGPSPTGGASRADPDTRARRDRRTRAARAEGRDARSTLLDAAADVFAQRGFDQASVDEVAARAGYSKGAVYWHFESKDDLFMALLDERLDRPTREMIELLESAPPDQDMGAEAGRRFVELLRAERDMLLLEQEYWSQAVRDPRVRARYAEREARLRRALGRALVTRVQHLGGPADEKQGEGWATAIMSLSDGLARQRLIDPPSVPDDLLGEMLVTLYAGIVARAAGAGTGAAEPAGTDVSPEAGASVSPAAGASVSPAAEASVSPGASAPRSPGRGRRARHE